MNVNYCGLTVNLTNNTGQGPVTFNSFSFFSSSHSGFSPGNVPFVVNNIVESGSTVQILLASGFTYNGTEYQAFFPTSGTAVFNLPNGDTLSIDWDLSPNNGNKITNSDPTFTPSGTIYSYSGINSPASSDGFNFVYNVSVS